MKYLVLSILICVSSTSWAVLQFDDYAIPELITSGRALGMDNAYLSKVDDGWSAFYNPAGLGTVRGLQFHLTNLHAEVNDGYNDLIAGEGNVALAGEKMSDTQTASGIRDLLADNTGTMSHTKYSAFPNITYRGFTLGYMYAKQARARLEEASSDLELAQRLDQGPVAALNISLFGGVIKFGGSGVILDRTEMQKDFEDGEELDIEEEDDFKKGQMTYTTTGFRLTIPWGWLPTFSAVSRNATNAEWGSPDLGGEPNEIPNTVDYSFSLTPQLGKVIRMHMEVVQRDVGNKYDLISPAKKLQAGLEFDFKRMMFVRFGYGQGWGTAGIGVRSRNFIFDLATYALERVTLDDDGEPENKVKTNQDRRYLFHIAMGF